MRSINRHSVSISVFVVVIVLLSAGSAFALDMEYYTYNGFDAIMGAFQKVALIFSDNGYKTLFFSVMVLGILIGALGMVVRVINGKFSPAAWAAPIGIGFIIYMCLIIPKATLHIYDPVKNRSQAVGDLPQGIVFVAGMLNLLERGLVDIVSTSGSPEGYDTQAGGVGFDMILNMGLKGIQLEDKTIHASLQKYTEDCLMFEMTRPGTVLNVNNVAKNKDFMSVYAEGQNPAAYTVYYNPSGGDETMTCTEAWNRLQAQLSSQSNFLASRKERCAAAGFDPTNPTEMNQCIGTIENTMAWLQGESYGINAIDQQTLLANTLAEAFAFYSPEAAARIYGSRNIGSSMVGSGIMANSWIPIIRAVITAIAIGLVPFMVIFIPTPLAGRAVGIIAGFFVWLTAWGVTDAIIHQFAMDYGKKVFEEVSRYQLGLAAVMNFTTAGAKTMAAFGAIRWTGIMLATVITGTLIKFGGTAMAHLSGQLTGSASSMGQSAGMKAMTPEGKANTISQFEAAPSVMANAHRFTFMDRADVHTMERMGKTKYGNEMKGSFGGVEGASDMIAQGNAGFAVSKAATGAAMKESPGGFAGAFDTMKFDKGSHLAYTRMVSNAFDGDYGKHGTMKASSLLGAIEGAGGIDNYIRNLHNTGQAEQMGLTKAARERSRVTGENYDNAFRNNIVDKVVFDSMKSTAGGQALDRMGYDNAVTGTANNETNTMQQGLSRQELAGKLGVSVDELQKREADITARQDYFNKTEVDQLAMELGKGNREAGYRTLAKYGLTGVRSDAAAFGSPEGTVAAQTVTKTVSHGNALGVQQAGHEIGMYARQFAKATSHLSAQEKIGVLKAMADGHLKKEDLRDTGFVKAVQSYFNMPQMIDSAKKGDTSIPRSLYAPDGKMDERMRQAWAEGNTKAVESMLNYVGKDTSSLRLGGALEKLGAFFGGQFSSDKATNHNLIKARFLELSQRAQDMSPEQGSRYLADKTKMTMGEVEDNLQKSWSWNKPISTHVKELPEVLKGPVSNVEQNFW